MFRVPSDPPSTPDRNRSSTNIHSTTPLGPPPSNTKHFSLTPNGHAASPAFGIPFGLPNSNQPFAGLSSHHALEFGKPAQSPAAWPSRSNGAAVPPSSPPRAGLFDHIMDEDGDMGNLASPSPSPQSLKSTLLGRGIKDEPRVVKRPRLGESENSMRASMQRTYKIDVAGFAKGIVAASSPPALNESDKLIVGTENIIDSVETDGDPSESQAAISRTASELLKFWDSSNPLARDEIESERIGPGPRYSPSAKANFLASLLVPLHHPSSWKSASVQKARFSQSLVLHDAQTEKTIPQALLGWLDAYHDPGADMVRGVLRYKDRGYSLADQYMDVVLTCLLRGQFTRVLTLLVQANWREQASDYTGPQLDHIDDGSNVMATLIGSCPALESEDWDIKGAQWSIFRRRVGHAKDELRRLLNGKGETDNITKSQLKFSLSRSSRRVESCLPQEVYDLFNDMCDVLLGDPEAILKSSCDWLEAVIFLTTWWDGEEDSNPRESTRNRFGARHRQTRTVDVTPALAYRQRVVEAFDIMLEEDDLLASIDNTDPVQVGLCSIIEGDLDSVINILKHLSFPFASGVVEIASVGGWLSSPRRLGANHFDKSDLMVLSYGGPKSDTGFKDNLLGSYAELLAGRESLYDEESGTTVEGWELALTVLGRLDDAEVAIDKVASLLQRIELTSGARVDKMLELCSHLGFTVQSQSLAERYADILAEAGRNYGDALLYYAKAHKPTKLKEVLNNLTTLCVVQSRAYPPASEIDDRLKSFLGSPTEAVSFLNSADLEAGRFLSTYLSGYATIRKFYDLRDEEVACKPGQKPSHRPLERKRLGAAALLAVISSAADSIRGGLFDAEVDVVVPVDNLLVLLGESLAFINQSTRILTISQITSLLKAAEDLETVNQRIFSRCTSTLQKTLAVAHGSSMPSPNTLLKKSISNLTTASSQFSLVGSSMLDSRDAEQGTSSDGSAILVKGQLKRGWDWRTGFKSTTQPAEVLRILRLGIGKELARSWVILEDTRE